MNNILTPKQYVDFRVHNYSMLYASSNFNTSRFNVIDHVLNTIGNGVYFDEFINTSDKTTNTFRVERLYNVTELSYGYYEKHHILDDCYMGQGEYICVPIDEKYLHPNIVHWVDFDLSLTKNPYPNFKKSYSMVWRGLYGTDNNFYEFKALGLEWVNEAIWFYQTCKEYFEGLESLNYHYAFPNSDRDVEQEINDMIVVLNKYENTDEISKAYGVEFVGTPNNYNDVYDFNVSRWQNEKERILKFIDETLTMLNDMIKDEV